MNSKSDNISVMEGSAITVAPMVAAIVAMDSDRIIGKDGQLPWHLPGDMAHFKALTSGHVVVMGRRTWDSLPERFRPLPNRVNIVVTRGDTISGKSETAYRVGSPEEGIERARSLCRPGQRIWIIGGAELYRTTMPLCDEVHVTLVHGKHVGDTRLPAFEEAFKETSRQKGSDYDFVVYGRI